VDGALREYEKLVETPESDPYNFVLLADLLYKKGEQGKAAERYLSAVQAYQTAGLYKNAIAVCKKMSRLSLSQSLVLRHLADLHALDGLAGEASMYYAQYADVMMRSNSGAEAVQALRKAFDLAQENVRLLEQLSELLLIEGQTEKAAEAMLEAARHWETRGQAMEAKRCHAPRIADRSQRRPDRTGVPGGEPARVAPAPGGEASRERGHACASASATRAGERVRTGRVHGRHGRDHPRGRSARRRAPPGVALPTENGSSPVTSPYDDRPEPPPTGGILTGSRIPGVTAPSVDAGQSPPPVASGPHSRPLCSRPSPCRA
jgi:hypothetical protein